MWSKVESYISKHKLLDDSKLYLVALSGGADSVALLLLLSEAGYKVHAAHCNFHLRGAESNRDEAFCVELCGALGIELHRAHFDTRTYAELHKVSIEMAARELRYSWFAQLCKDLGAAGVCVAHHRDDSVETVLLNLVRGTGLRGLTGIKPRIEHVISNGRHAQEQSKTTVLRPLLCVSRVEIEDYLAKRGQTYVTDSTNMEADVMRNKIRLQVLPLLQTLNPAVAENIQRTAENLAEAQMLLDGIVDKYTNRKTLDLNELSQYSSSEYIIFEWLKNFGFNGKQMEQIMAAETGSLFTSPTGFELLKDRSSLIVEVLSQPTKPTLVPEEGTYVVRQFDGQAIKEARYRIRQCAAYISKAPHIATLDAAKVHFPLTIRSVEEGDWMIPYGMTGRKLLSDLMTDLKMNIFEKRRQLLVVDAQGIVVWAVGLRTDQRVAVSDETKEVLELYKQAL